LWKELFNIFIFLKKALKLCINKPKAIVDRGPWYRWALERPWLDYEYQTFSMKIGERFFRYLK